MAPDYFDFNVSLPDASPTERLTSKSILYVMLYVNLASVTIILVVVPFCSILREKPTFCVGSLLPAV